ncbi:protein-disulfide reductase DsbD N-terminal domain-containing protein [Parapedobacter sp. 10938]|uniref:protein-disulfide reductase DsbD N-terminal domain-containing protein n=1 Tax=Parapedobacter flavus TaxID=3110225 RepID=UPI002DB72457|nr:protein-disulfide reductase DsbD N-terminal domain-containing protein [Parapedobacter sp. 10938]MEC3880019.1 protein-disulfide reductase DsbD N-terminal domain-containing protein [Parapedobacter sp. 10938]
MRKVVLAAMVLCFAATGAFAQILKPVTWQFGAKKISKDEAVVFIKATIDKGWHIYSQHVEEGGPIKTSFTFSPSTDYTLVGKPAEPKPKTKYEEVFAMDVGYFDKEVVFQQKVKLKKGATTVKGAVEFMACDANQCLPPDEVTFAVAVK